MTKARITKDPELRKTELLDAAEELFLSRGFDETSVSDIVSKIGVAQGLFYYYFKSKDEILNAVVERFSELFFADMSQFCNDDRLSAVQKIQATFRLMDSIVNQNEKIVSFVHEERNELMHYRMERKFADRLIALFANIIEQGVREGVFDVEYPEETATILLVGLGKYMHDALSCLHDRDMLIEKVQIALAVLEKTLGASGKCLSVNHPILGTGENHE
jgi:AcrR family transcriptional regulator